MSNTDHSSLMASLGYCFSDHHLLKQALTHRSAGQPHYERLEFLGDSLLNFIIAQALFKRFPDVCEGTLTRLRSQLVNGQLLALIGKELGVQRDIRLGKGETRSGGQHRAALLADVVEAMIGAIYLDSDMTQCQACVHRWYGDRLDTITPETLQKDPKTTLQEYLQGKQFSLPRYTIVDVQGPAHDVTFSAHCTVPEIDYTTEGKGNTRRKAEQQAAEAYLQWLLSPAHHLKGQTT